MKWSEHAIAGALSRQFFQRKCLVLVDNCNWTGYECDVLGVTMDRRLIDVEIKISRADLKADAAKDKWWKHMYSTWNTEKGRYESPGSVRREWPPKVWKHYYCMPAEIWKPELASCLHSSKSGILLMYVNASGFVGVECERRATPCRDADRISEADCLNIARLASLRMWDAYERRDKAVAEAAEHRLARMGVAA